MLLAIVAYCLYNITNGKTECKKWKQIEIVFAWNAFLTTIYLFIRADFDKFFKKLYTWMN